MNVRIATVLLCGSLLLSVMTATSFAHHSYAMFDQTKIATVEGTMAKVEWKDPHVWFWAYVSDGKGGYDLYGFESASINNLARQGWTLSTLKPNDKVTIQYNPLVDGRHGGFFRSATFPDGSKTPGGN